MTLNNEVSMKACSLPDILEGHWNSEGGRERAERCLTETRSDLSMSHLSDMELANAVFLVDRFSPELINYTIAAKERIRWLSTQLAATRTASLPSVAIERVWRDGWKSCRDSLTEDEAFCLTADVENDAWADSDTRAALTTQSKGQDDGK